MQTTPPPTVRLKLDGWTARMTRLRLGSVEEQAEHIGVSRSQLYRIIAGDVAPGEQFIAAALAATGAKFEQLFEVAS